ncbi:MAG: bifunctional hydroxymethylpyrimidine kinase/phosphomethylpyrimidine kinase [Muribaculaceae bacterium]|nr:bifunctional hydroxymethylpyrimidine kinase/phosphomethylpyrimidine kinase [Muribaculaceae bacterium]
MNEKSNRMPVVVSIAGSDNSGGAGIQADIKTCDAMRCYAATVVTAVTAQSYRGVEGVEYVGDEMLRLQLKTIFEAMTPDAIKIGMIPCESAVDIISEVLAGNSCRRIVIDPVAVSTTGHSLSGNREETIAHALERLYPLAELITPNLPEAEYLSWLSAVRNKEDITLFRGAEECAKQLRRYLPSTSILIKGGHCEGLVVTDRLYETATSDKALDFSAMRIKTLHSHGTGCTLSTAIACGLAKGNTLRKSIEDGKAFVTSALARGRDLNIVPTGGPLGFFE